MKKSILFVLFVLSNTLIAQYDFSEEDRVLNQADLDQWIIPENNIWWSVEKGTLVGKSDLDLKGSNLWSKEDLKDFVIKIDFKMGEGTVDSGIFIRGESSNNPQIQIGISGSLKRDMTASPYVPSKGYPKEALVSSILKPKKWNALEVKAIKNNYKVWLNGAFVMDYTLENANLSGPVGFQVHRGKEMKISIKNIFLKKL